MEGEEGGGIRLSKRFSDDNKGGAGSEVDYKTKSGTAWSHSYLNQKPWHPLSYPNQRRKWIAEQTHANRERRTEEVAREASTQPSSTSIIPIPIPITLFLSFCSMLRSKSFIAKPISYPRRTRRRFNFALDPFFLTSFPFMGRFLFSQFRLVV